MKKIILFFAIFNCIFTFSQEAGGTRDDNGASKINEMQRSSARPSVGNPTGSSSEVGITEGQLAVSLSGGAMYSIPIKLPPGINGVVPMIELAYNSQGENGLAGYGWNISGLSVIKRLSSTKFHDGSIDPVDFDNLDRFSFDGQRLLVKNGSTGIYGGANTVYETESHTNIQITSYGVHPSGANYGPAYFVVQYPDGAIAQYGNSANSRSINEWAIMYWQNPQGVRINYGYIHANNSLKISTIKYGSRLTGLPINEISFVYQARTRAEQAFIGGQSSIDNTILKQINVKGNGKGFRNYVLAHDANSLGYQRLISLTEKSGDNTKILNPTVFSYETTSNDGLFDLGPVGTISTLSGLSNINLENHSTISGDFNGDGKMDVILYPSLGTNMKKKYWLLTDIKNNLNYPIEHNVGAFENLFPVSWLNHLDKLMPMEGWCAIQHNSTTNITSFKSYSAGISSPISLQNEKTYEFPKFSYTVDCPNLPACGLSQNGVNNVQEGDSFAHRDFPVLDPDPITCPQPANVSLSPIISNQATLMWTDAPIVTMWEVCYFETGTAPNPSSSVPVGTYSTTTQNFLEVSNLMSRKFYSFFVRSICSGQPSAWVGPINSGGLITPNPRETRYRVVPKEYVSGDFNGDGLTDVIAIDKNTSYSSVVCQGDCYTNSTVAIPGGKTYFVNLDRRLTEGFVNASGQITTTSNSKFVVADVNGDGKSDLMVFEPGAVKAYSLNDNNQLVSMFSTYIEAGILSDMPRYMGDFNGDGKMDFVIPQVVNTDSWAFYFSTGTGYTKVISQLGFAYITSSINWFRIVGFPEAAESLQEVSYVPTDINGDGKTDMILQGNFTCYRGGGCANGTPQLTLFRVFENAGFNGTTLSFTETYVHSQYGNIGRYPIPVLMDHNNPNQNSEYTLISGSSIRTFKSPKDNKIDMRLKEITVGNGVKEVITYSSLGQSNSGSNFGNVFTPSTYTENYPNFDIHTSPIHIVAMLEKVSQGEYKKRNFKYYGAVTNLQGIGFLGFRGLSQTNWFNDDFPAVTSISKYDVHMRGTENEKYSFLGDFSGGSMGNIPSDFISKSVITSVSELLPNKVFKISRLLSVVSNGLDGTSIETSLLGYDVYNNPNRLTIVHKKGAIEEKKEVTILEYLNQPIGSTYFIGRVGKKMVTSALDGDLVNSMTAEEIYNYNTAHHLHKIFKKGHLTNSLVEENVYDVYGNIIKKTNTAVGLAPRIEDFTYDSSGRFLLSSTSVDRLTTNFTYDTSTGKMLSKTLPSSVSFPLKTEYEYDVWGRLKQSKNYLGRLTNHIFTMPEPNTIMVTTNGEDGSSSILKYDDLGRVQISGKKNIDGSWSYIKNAYDIYDRLVSASEPFPTLSGTPSQFTTSSYDSYGRLEQTVSHAGKTTSISYLGLDTTTDDGIKKVITTKNSIGDVVSSTDDGGTITYHYYPNSNLKMSSFNGIETKIKQDGWGRKTELFDPSTGLYEYKYNDFGQITDEFTPKGKTTYTIDAYGTITGKRILGLNGDTTNSETKYTIDPTTKNVTEINFVDYLSGFSMKNIYAYDDYQRLNFSEENSSGYYQRAYFYDQFGRPEKELYTAINIANVKRSDKWIRHSYKNGYHWQIIDDATSAILWEAKTVTARGQLASANYGNGISILNSYDQYGFPLQSKHTKSGIPSVDLMVLSTTYAPQTGNLTYRHNSLFDYKEDFTYDNLDRLSNWKETGDLLWDCNFSNSVQGFQPIAGAGVSLSSGVLRVSASGQGKGTEKLVLSNAVIGQKIDIKGKLAVQTAATGTTLRISFYEKDPVTGQMINNTTLGMPIGNGNFSFGTTVTTYSDIYVKFAVHNVNGPAAFMVYDLDDVKISRQINESQGYDDMGRIEENNIGVYSYKEAKPFQNSSIDLGNDAEEYFLTRNTLNINFNCFKGAIDISEEGKDKLSFLYDMNNRRSTMYYGSLASDKLLRPFRKHYSSDGVMEIKENINGEVEFITYIGGDAYSAPLILKSNGATQDYFYLHRDNQGSILAVTNQSGNIVEKRLFDAWGNCTRIQDGQGNNLAKLVVIDRGYTGHEHLQGVNLIHMNGRIYDPVTHRLLQPDNYVQDPFNTQNFNRFGYCLNNPTRYTDPTGEIIPLIVVGIVVVSVAANIYSNWDDITGGTGKFSDVKWGKFAGYAAVGVVNGALTVYGGPLGPIWAGGASGLLNSMVKGDDMSTTLTNTGFGLLGGAVSLGVGAGVDKIVPMGFFTNKLLNGVTTGLVTGFISNYANTFITTGSFDKAWKAATDPVAIVSSGISGGLESGLPKKDVVATVRDNVSNIYQLQIAPLVQFPVVLPVSNFTPVRTVIPPTFYVNLPKPTFRH